MSGNPQPKEPAWSQANQAGPHTAYQKLTDTGIEADATTTRPSVPAHAVQGARAGSATWDEKHAPKAVPQSPLPHEPPALLRHDFPDAPATQPDTARWGSIALGQQMSCQELGVAKGQSGPKRSIVKQLAAGRSELQRLNDAAAQAEREAEQAEAAVGTAVRPDVRGNRAREQQDTPASAEQLLEGQEGIFNACDAGDVDAARAVLELHGEAVNARRPVSPSTCNGVKNFDLAKWVKHDHLMTPLHTAAFHGDSALTALLLQHNADVDVRTERTHRSPLIFAIRRGHVGVVRMLLDAGSSTDGTELCDAVMPAAVSPEAGSDVLALLFERGLGNVSSSFEFGIGGHTTLMFAAESDNLGAVKLLLSHKADVNAVRSDGTMALHVVGQSYQSLFYFSANKYCNGPEICQALLDAKASIEAQSLAEAATPLHIACKNSNEVVAKCLIQNRANLEAKTATGRMPLHEAAGATSAYGAWRRGPSMGLLKFILDHKPELINAADERSGTALSCGKRFCRINPTRCHPCPLSLH